MNIIQEHIDDLNVILKVNVTPGDYQKPFDEALKKYSKNISMPGFRRGMVPVSLVRKMYGKALLADELNKIVADSVNNYITENKIEILGNPLPNEQNEIDMNPEQPQEMEFRFDMGLAPKVEPDLPPKHKFTYYEIEVSDEEINSEIERLQRRHGNYINPEVSDAETSLYGRFTEIDMQGNVIEGGHSHESFILPDKIKDSSIRPMLAGLKKGDSITFNPFTATGNDTDAKYLLGIEETDHERFNKPFLFSVERINKVEKAELNQQLFDSIYGEGAVNSIDEFREKIKAEIAESYRYESEYRLKHDLEDYFLHSMNINLPDEFLKRWIRHSNSKITEEDLNKEYSAYARDLKWRMIENKIFKDQDMTIEKEDLDNYSKHYIMDQYLRYGQAHLLNDEKLSEMSEKFLANPDNVQRSVENITSKKVFDFLKNIVEKEVHKVSYDEFVTEMKEHVH